MRDDQRGTQPPRARQKAPAGTPKAGQGRPAAARAGAPKTDSRYVDDAYRKPAKPRPRAQSGADPYARQRVRREAEYLYPDDAYYKKPSGKKRSASQMRAKPKKGKKKRSNPLYVLFYLAFAVVAALLISFLLRTFVFEIVRVNGDAMFETLQPGDWVIVTKFDYWTSNPARGEIVAVNVSGEDSVILRRIVGLPEERVQIDGNGDTLINGQPIGESYVTLRSYEEYPEITLNRGRYFVLSDNRDNQYEIKLDSRSESVGMVAKKDIVGRVRGVVWPPSRR